jgi:hypothetical protein
MTMQSIYTDKSVKKALLNLSCKGYEGHVPDRNMTIGQYGGQWPDPFLTTDDSTPLMIGFRCKKCGCLVYVNETELEYIDAPSNTPRMP